MISPPPSPTLSAVHSTENDTPALSPKRSFAHHDEDQLPSLESKRRHVHPEAAPPRRAPLDPLSASDLENRRGRDLLRVVSSPSHYSLLTSSLPDLRSLQPDLPEYRKSCGQPRSATPGDSVCSWPPPVSASPADNAIHSKLVGQEVLPSSSLHSSGRRNVSRATFSEPISTWYPFDSLNIQPTTTMAKSPRTASWKSDTILQPIRSRTSSMPSVRRPPGDLWQSDSEPVKTTHETGSTGSYSTLPAPPGLSPQPEHKQRDSDSNLISHSVSSSLAPGTQPLPASAQMKSVPPIGAERSRVVSMTPLRSQSRSLKPTAVSTSDSDDPLSCPWSSSLLSPRLQAKWKNFLLSSDANSREKPVESFTGGVSREDFERLLRHAIQNKYATKIISPLSPLRDPPPAFPISSDSEFQLRMPSLSNHPSPRYSRYPARRTRTLCDSYQSHNFDIVCVHCQECKRDTVGKRLLAFRFRQQQSQVQRYANHISPARSMTASVTEDRLILSECEREGFVLKGDEDEKTLWDEIVAVTSTVPPSFSLTGSSCRVAAHRRSPPATPRLRDLHDFDDGNDDDFPEIPDEDFLVNESVSLLREVSVC